MWHVSFLEDKVYDIMPRLNIWMKKRMNNKTDNIRTINLI